MIGIPCAALFAGSALLVFKEHSLRKTPLKDAWGALCLYTLWAVLFYIVLIQEDRDRYMASLCMISPLFIGYLFSRINMRSRFLAIALLTALLAYNCYTIAYSFPSKGANRYYALAEKLVSAGLRYGFSDYETAYIAQFATKEKSVISPTLFHPTFSDRWPADTKLARNSPEAFYVIDKYQYPEAAWIMDAVCKKRGIRFTKEDVGGFEIYYGLSSKLYPEELLLSERGIRKK
jgi:hypothetical protein